MDRSVRNEHGEVKLSLPAESLLTHLFGKRYFHIHGVFLSQKKWHRILGRLLDTVERCISVNIETDALHLSELQRYLRIARRAVDSKENADPEAIIALIGICVELLGAVPDNRTKTVVNKHPNNYRTTFFRTLRYDQSLAQKTNTILRSAHWPEFQKYYSADDLWREYRGDASAFMDWFKGQYPEAYAKLF